MIAKRLNTLICIIVALQPLKDGAGIAESRIPQKVKQSLIDYLGNISSVVFTQDCNFCCPYCHNPNLVLPNKFGTIFYENKIFVYFAKYKNMLDAVCISGVEPTIHKDLPLFIKKIKALGLKVKLDSNGTNPEMIKLLIQSKLVDYIAIDIKHTKFYKIQFCRGQHN